MSWSVVAYLLAVNVASFAAFASDKHRARTSARRRIPERTLLHLAAIGGSPGAVAAQQLLRHKTRKEPFRTVLTLICVAQALLAMIWWRFSPGSAL